MIEILIVAGLVLVLVVFGSKFFRNKTAYVIKSETRKLSGLIQQTYNMAIATNQTRRLVINFDQASQDQHGTHWVEARSDPQSKFNKVDRFSKFTLPKEVKFKDVYFPSLEKKIETDQAFIHFFSQGQAEPAILHVEDVQKAIYSIKIHPLTGRATIHAGYEQ
ncbi:MAG: hypothetical protein HYS98_02290 [Deltaproteobacteria bacterium]|nr:hypothetical protein [Deltaproteobacteria bacterium]